jgi:Pentapeptide repeats (8 copies)
VSDANHDSNRLVPQEFDSWHAYWTAQEMPWRTEPEISLDRQTYLSARRAIKPDITQGIYPFNGVEPKLSRADIEWLLATHEAGGMVGPIDWSWKRQRTRSGVDLRGADLRALDLSGLPLARMQGGLTGPEYDQAAMAEMDAAAVLMSGTILRYAHLEEAALTHARLDGAQLAAAHLESADLYGVHLAASIPADLTGIHFNKDTRLDRATFVNPAGIGPRLAGAQWNNVSLAQTDWSALRQLDDEVIARSAKGIGHRGGDRRLHAYQRAVQAYRQLATALRSQGLSEDADRISYRAQLLQRKVLTSERHYPAAAGSWLLDLISGYGYKPARSVITYLLVILTFASAYFALTNLALTPFLPSHSSPLAWYEAIVLSISSFHGRGLFPSGLSLGDPVAVLAAFEAIIGLLIEITFIATFTQRFFAR